MHLTYHTDYALRVFIYLMSRPDQPASTREMASAYHISLHHLTKVTKALTKHGWLVASRGRHGGLRLAPHAPELTLGEIVRATENTDLTECFNAATNTCPIHRCCQLKTVLFQARQAFFAVLDAHTVRDLAHRPQELRALLAVSARTG